MEIKTIHRWADHLLDVGKRNNLVNFKDTKLSTADVIAPDFDTLFHQVGHATVFEVFDPTPEDDDDDVIRLESDMEDDGQEESVPSLETYRSLYENKLKRGQILVYNASGRPIGALKNICKKGREAVEETGVNIVYLAFGFIRWTEEEHPHTVMRAPLLLVPVTLENESALEPYRMRVSDDEIIVNPTFSFKLHSEYNIELPAFDDEEDVEAYFAKVESLLSKIRWTVSRECKLGIFSFMKINMYRDLKDNDAIIAESPIVCSIMGEAVEASGTTAELTESRSVDLMELHNVVDADSSQSEAIEMALEGKSFVLQGPPGTGKSQTITNIIAECLHDGKTVLFVSEKLAALRVVYEKLKQVGLAEFCLELHSHKASKKQVIGELCHTLRAQKSDLSESAREELDIRRKARFQLDAYARELHTVRPGIGKTLYQIYQARSACREAPDVECIIRNIREKNDSYRAEAVAALERYVDYVPTIGYDYHRHAWYGFDTEDIGYQAKMQLREDLGRVGRLCAALQTISDEAACCDQPTVGCLKDAQIGRRFYTLVKSSRYISPAVWLSGDLRAVMDTAAALKPLAETILAKKAYLDERYDADVYTMDGSDICKKLTRQFTSVFSRMFNSEYRGIIKQLKLCRKTGKAPGYGEAVADMEVLRAYRETLTTFEETAGNTALFGKEYRGAETDFDALIAELRALSEIHDDGMNYAGLSRLSADEFAERQAAFGSIARLLDEAFTESDEAEARLIRRFDAACRDVSRLPLRDLAAMCTACLSELDQVDHFLAFSKLQKQIRALDLTEFLDCMITENVRPEEMADAYKKAFYTQWADVILQESPIFSDLSRIPHDRLVELFREKDREHMGINRATIRARVSAKRPMLTMTASGSAVSVLIREGEKKRKQKSVRQLLSECGDLALTIKPCFLMSPLSVSTFLDANMRFDVVIFDEASQIFPQDALGAIYRGRQLIVVGDSKQMPPSNFFDAAVEAENDSEDETVADFESILDWCSVTLPQCRLKWHYRSRCEDLIAFSNKNFYDNDLITFPSAHDAMEDVGVDYCYVDGTFDRVSKTNRAEAELVTDLVFRHFEINPERSLGVVAFSVAQQTLIERLIAKRRQIDASKEAFFRSDRPEPFFVKNLETVQGDERDTIIFSIAYAKDTQGRLLLNFGPLNRLGGERRLNVAVTRAKYHVQLVTSMHAYDIDLARSQSEGVRLLREYLDYAENGSIALDRSLHVSAYDRFDFEFETEVCAYLREKGYEVDTQVGCSAFKIDMALKQPGSSRYLLAIECDGAAYHASKTARDRDRLRQSILETMGWQFYRIWSTDWFRNPRVEKERLLAAVQAAVDRASADYADSEEEPLNASDTADAFLRIAESEEIVFPPYQMVNIRDIQEECRFDKLQIVRTVLETEAPVSEEWMLKRMVHLYGREKVTSVVMNSFENDMCGCESAGVVRRNGFLYLADREVPLLRVPGDGGVRDVKYIAPEELAAGLTEILRQNVTVEKIGLYRFLASLLGFSRMGEALYTKFEEALALLQDVISVENGVVSWK